MYLVDEGLQGRGPLRVVRPPSFPKVTRQVLGSHRGRASLNLPEYYLGGDQERWPAATLKATVHAIDIDSGSLGLYSVADLRLEGGFQGFGPGLPCV